MYTGSMDSGAFEEIKRRLAQTIFWCSSRADQERPATSLRTPYLRPPTLEANRSFTVNCVVNRRELIGEREIRDAQIPADLAGGRLLIYFPEDNLCCGAAEQETLGFFDVDNVPPWDTWVTYFDEQQSNLGLYDKEYLIAWIPSEFVYLADRGIYYNPEQCIQWLSDTTVELAKALRAANLLR